MTATIPPPTIYRERPLTVQAVQWTGSNWDEINELIQSAHIPGLYALGQESGRNRLGEPVPPAPTENILLHRPVASQAETWLRPQDWLVLQPPKTILIISHEAFRGRYVAIDEGTVNVTPTDLDKAARGLDILNDWAKDRLAEIKP